MISLADLFADPTITPQMIDFWYRCERAKSDHEKGRFVSDTDRELPRNWDKLSEKTKLSPSV